MHPQLYPDLKGHDKVGALLLMNNRRYYSYYYTIEHGGVVVSWVQTTVLNSSRVSLDQPSFKWLLESIQVCFGHSTTLMQGVGGQKNYLTTISFA